MCQSHTEGVGPSINNLQLPQSDHRVATHGMPQQPSLQQDLAAVMAVVREARRDGGAGRNCPRAKQESPESNPQPPRHCNNMIRLTEGTPLPFTRKSM